MELPETTMSRKQRRETETRAPGYRARRGRRGHEWPSARSCRMEAVDEPQHRTQVKLRKATWIRVSAPRCVTPDFRTGSRRSGDGGGGKPDGLTQGDLQVSTRVVGRKEETTIVRCTCEKSDHLVVALKPGNAGGAKGVTR